MAKWIVEASPIHESSETEGAVAGTSSFMTDNAQRHL